MKPRYYIACLFFAVFILYPLSIGPVGMFYFRIYPQGTKDPHWARVLYAPLIFAHNKSSTFANAFDWYMRLWIPNY
jgi:hypothetical protein